jgi:hypothetical protein
LIEVEVQAEKISMLETKTGQSVDARMIVATTWPWMVRTARYVRQHAKVIVERVVLLHHDDDVVNRVEVAVSAGSSDRGGNCGHHEKQTHRYNRRAPHGFLPSHGVVALARATPEVAQVILLI